MAVGTVQYATFEAYVLVTSCEPLSQIRHTLSKRISSPATVTFTLHLYFTAVSSMVQYCTVLSRVQYPGLRRVFERACFFGKAKIDHRLLRLPTGATRPTLYSFIIARNLGVLLKITYGFILLYLVRQYLQYRSCSTVLIPVIVRKAISTVICIITSDRIPNTIIPDLKLYRHV